MNDSKGGDSLWDWLDQSTGRGITQAISSAIDLELALERDQRLLRIERLLSQQFPQGQPADPATHDETEGSCQPTSPALGGNKPERQSGQIPDLLLLLGAASGLSVRQLDSAWGTLHKLENSEGRYCDSGWRARFPLTATLLDAQGELP